MSIKKNARQLSGELDPKTSESLEQLVESVTRSAKPPAAPMNQTGLARIVQLAEAGRLEKALQLASRDNPDPAIRNARAVILMRLGRHVEAISLLRPLVMRTNCTWMRPESPVEFKLNFACALLLSGKASGCRAILDEIHDVENQGVKRIDNALGRWLQTLSAWDRFRFRMWGIQPADHPIGIDFPPGEFGWTSSGSSVPANEPPPTVANASTGLAV